MKKLKLLPVIVYLITTLLSCSDEKIDLYNTAVLTDWQIQSSDSIKGSGENISSNSFKISDWYSAKVPETVLHTLVRNGGYKNIYVNDNLAKISEKPFKTSWWYRTEFTLKTLSAGLLLKIDGINYKANIWLNGKLVADTATVQNSFRQFRFDIKKYVQKGRNTLAIEVYPPVPGDFSIGFVDWNPVPPDRNMGIFREVYIEANGGISVTDPFVASSLENDLSKAVIQASVVVTNHTDTPQKGYVTLSFDDIYVRKKLSLKPGESRKIVCNAGEYPQLNINNPKLWWPHTMGNPYLHKAVFAFEDSNKILDSKDVKFGIRSVSKYFTNNGARGYRINGKKILIRGSGWVDRLMLENTKKDIEAQLDYVKDINLNTIRMEGFWGKDQTIYDLCDEKGILIMVGWSCQWEWSYYLGKPTHDKYGGIVSNRDMRILNNALKDQIVWLRNHPSIFSWVGGSDLQPKPELEKMYFDTFHEYDSTRVFLASAKNTTTLDGPTGVKMEGPYAYVPPVYWYSDSTKGGAYGFNTETGPGAQMPPLQSLKKMLSENHLWPIDTIWNYHCGRFEFGDLHRYIKAINNRYGAPQDIIDFEKKAQLLNYELMRPMFEAFSAYRYKATGVIQWMLNSAWPEMYWQLYDYYLMPNGAYYGAKIAQRPYHIIYDYYRKSLFAVNDKLEDKPGCKLKLRVYDINSKLILQKEKQLDLKANSSKEILSLASLKIPTVLFIDTRLYDNSGKIIDNNFYWISHQEDILDYEDTSEAWYVTTPSKQYGDFKALNTMPKVKVESNMLLRKGDGETIFEVTLKNKSDKIAFFIHVAINDSNTGETVLPVIWSDNYVSLLPGEKRVLTAEIKDEYLDGKNTKLVVDGYNLK
ncbi:MAG: glycoside hydrolase family 2 [Chlorobi bacterium]|nr:glycoside hydrolase family 2 [Chlorobiota bacterium]